MIISYSGVSSVKASFRELFNKGELDTNTGFYNYQEKIVSIFYFRSGYAIEQLNIKGKK